MKNIRLIHFVTDLDRLSGGPSVSVPELCSALAAIDGVAVHLVARQTSDPTLSDHDSSFPIHWTDGRPSSVGKLVEDLTETGDESFTIVHLHGLWDPLMHYAAKEAFRKGVPTVYSIRGMLEPWALKHKRCKKWIGWWAYQRRDLSRAALLHGTSTLEIESIERAGLESIPSVSIPNGVSLPQLPHPTVSNSNSRSVLGFMGRIHPIKGLPNLLEAWAADAPDGWDLKIAGPNCGGHKDDLHEQLNRLGIAESVHFLDSLAGEEKWGFLQSIDCLILPSYSENFGMVVAEALAAGTPVAATTGSPWALLEETRAGWSVAPTVESISSFLRELSSKSVEDLKEMGVRGHQLVKKDFTWQAVAKRFIEEYRKIPGPVSK